MWNLLFYFHMNNKINTFVCGFGALHIASPHLRRLCFSVGVCVCVRCRLSAFRHKYLFAKSASMISFTCVAHSECSSSRNTGTRRLTCVAVISARLAKGEHRHRTSLVCVRTSVCGGHGKSADNDGVFGEVSLARAPHTDAIAYSLIYAIQIKNTHAQIPPLLPTLLLRIRSPRSNVNTHTQTVGQRRQQETHSPSSLSHISHTSHLRRLCLTVCRPTTIKTTTMNLLIQLYMNIRRE